MKSIRRKKTHNEFNPSLERNLLMNRTSKNYALFMSTKYGEKQEHMWMSTRGALTGIHNKAHRNTKPFPMDGSNTLRFSLGEPVMTS